MKIGILSDTHGYLDEKIFDYFKDCDEIWHAGDVGDIEVTDKLKAFKKLRCVHGNIDGGDIRKEFKETIRFTLGGMHFLMTHIGGKPYVYSKNIVNEITNNPPDVFICGHSHILKVQYDKRIKSLYINPGACGKHGFHKVRTIIRVEIKNKQLTNMEVIELGKRA